MKISPLDLDGAGSPAALVTCILAVERDLPIPVPIEELSERLGIISIEELKADGFAAALVTDVNRLNGGILVAKSLSPERRRFSIGHELGHFLIPTHVVPPEGRFLCSREDMLRFDPREQDRRKRMEIEANRFSALLLMPPPVLRAELGHKAPSLDEVVRLALEFGVSKEAMARAYAEYNRAVIAIVRVHQGKLLAPFRSGSCPWIAPSVGDLVPHESAWHDGPRLQGTLSRATKCDPDMWFDERTCRSIDALTEQILIQAGDYSMIMLTLEMRDDEDDAGSSEPTLRSRY